MPAYQFAIVAAGASAVNCGMLAAELPQVPKQFIQLLSRVFVETTSDVGAIVAAVSASTIEGKKVLTALLLKKRKHAVLDAMAATASEAELVRFLHGCTTPVVKEHLGKLAGNRTVRWHRYCRFHPSAVVALL